MGAKSYVCRSYKEKTGMGGGLFVGGGVGGFFPPPPPPPSWIRLITYSHSTIYLTFLSQELLLRNFKLNLSQKTVFLCWYFYLITNFKFRIFIIIFQMKFNTCPRLYINRLQQQEILFHVEPNIFLYHYPTPVISLIYFKILPLYLPSFCLVFD